MDLGSCPKCSARWVVGDERCRECGYTAIGAGLSRLPKKKKKRPTKYAEPGGYTSTLSFTLAVILLWGGFYYHPWQNDWDFIRSLFGQGRHHSLNGEWEITETIQEKGSQNDMFTKTTVASGSFAFDGQNTVRLVISNSAGNATASGHYVVDGTAVTISDLQVSGNSTTSLPTKLDLTLIWTGPDAAIAEVSSTDAIMMCRKGKGLDQVSHMLYDKSGNDSPDSVKGSITRQEGKGDDL